ncbi:disease resistance protein RGA2-like [Triticum dicoccoides]|uniref:disease resistance protein RGA2-like n=1 Tax=Triticum dicoccoides TaxID=85692 RepID=UPI001891CBF2|nr:disease resistance protein RGA2-like [Triticum dicoccoides]
MAALVASTVLGPMVKIMMEKASSYLLNQHKVMKGMKKQLESLKGTLLAILDVITDIEEAAAHRAGGKAWLEKAKKVAYQANEVFDDFKYEALRREAKKKGHYKELGFHVVKLFPTHNRFVFRKRMGRKLHKVVRAFEVLVTEMNAFHFERHQPPPESNNWRQKDQDIFDPKEIARRSRAKDSKKIVDILVGQAKNADLTVVPIVGMGGLGKTTLAQIVYNDPEIQKHFDVLLWVGVSDSFDVNSLAKSIVEAAPKKKDDDKEAAGSKKKKTPLDSLQNLVSGQRYLLVLDDVWKLEVDKWGQLKARLQHGGVGSVVLTTTRDEGVAEIMRPAETYNLRTLEDQYIKEIIETTAFGCFQRKENWPAVLVNMVGEIVKRCMGSPLAATALGSVLRTKTSEEEWKAVSSRSNICTEESGILPILNLSYNDLPTDMKQCFAFCAIFPKGYMIDVDMLIQLWIAHGFLIQEDNVRLETTGKRIFNDLACRSFFQDVKKVQATGDEVKYTGLCYSMTICKIHDLMHDVALSVMGKECALATWDLGNIEHAATEESSQCEWLTNDARHLFWLCNEPERKLNISLEGSSPSIQTLLCLGVMESSSLRHLSKYGSLRALQLCLWASSFPLKPKHLHQLRYLDLSGSYIKALPDDFSILYNLQTLNLSGCIYLCRLPGQLKYMTALRHLYTHGCLELKSMPRDLRELTSLQTLTCFVAGSGSDCSNVGELTKLNLGGQLELRQLENVTNDDAKAANLMQKKELRELTLTWTFGWALYIDETTCHCRDDEDDARVLENLRPHDELHAIRIESYGGSTFPTWLAVLQNITKIHLFSCGKLQWLFRGECDTSFAFPNLKELTLKDLYSLERWWEMNNYGVQGGEIMFPLLEKLHISDCVKLKALPGHPTFPKLQNVCIKKCPELTTTGFSPMLSELNVDGYEAELFLWVARHLASLTNLVLTSLNHSAETTSVAAEDSLRQVVSGKKKGNDQDFPLAVLVLTGFKSGVAEMCACFAQLQELSIFRSDALVHWPEEEFRGLVSLRELDIWDCNYLIGYAQASVEPSTSSETSQLLPRLESLSIHRCQSLVDVFNVPASVRKIYIHTCRKLEFTFGRRVQQGQSESSILQESSSISEVLASSSPGAMVEHLEELVLNSCKVLTGVLHLPPSLKDVTIAYCGGLTSLQSRSGELPSLERLTVIGCKNLSSLPDGPQAYSSLRYLKIRYCPGMKTLPVSLQQRLGSIPDKDISARFCEDAPKEHLSWKQKAWKYVSCRDLDAQTTNEEDYSDYGCSEDTPSPRYLVPEGTYEEEEDATLGC